MSCRRPSMADALRENADGERRCWTGCSESLLLLILAFIALTLFRACRVVCSRNLKGVSEQVRAKEGRQPAASSAGGSAVAPSTAQCYSSCPPLGAFFEKWVLRGGAVW